jgi:hypothetical protein
MLHDDCSPKPQESNIGSRSPTLSEEAHRARTADAEGETVLELFVEGLDDTRAHAGRRDWDTGLDEGRREMQLTAYDY